MSNSGSNYPHLRRYQQTASADGGLPPAADAVAKRDAFSGALLGGAAGGVLAPGSLRAVGFGAAAGAAIGAGVGALRGRRHSRMPIMDQDSGEYTGSVTIGPRGRVRQESGKGGLKKMDRWARRQLEK